MELIAKTIESEALEDHELDLVSGGDWSSALFGTVVGAVVGSYLGPAYGMAATAYITKTGDAS